MCLRVFGSMGLLRLRGMLCRRIGVVCVAMALVALFVPWIPGMGGFPRLAWLLQVGL